MKPTAWALLFLVVWRVIFYITGICLLIGGIVASLPWVGVWLDIPWLGQFTNDKNGMILYGGLLTLNREQANMYISGIFIVFPIVGWAGYHFTDFARDFPIRVYPDLFKEK